jgi:hypothetical protein
MTSRSRRKRVLHIYQSPSYSGAEAYARDVALWHAKNQIEVVFLVKAESPLFKKLLADMASLGSQNFLVESEIQQIDLRSFDSIILHSTRELKNHWPHLLWKLAGKSSTSVALYSHIWISHSKRDPIHYLLYRLVDQFWGSSEASKKNPIWSRHRNF